MNPHFGPGPYVPLPSPDGLSRAFRAADRRRLRSAMLAAAMPVLVAFALATPSGINGSAGLEPAGPPGQGGTASPTPSVRPTEPAPTQPGGALEPHPLGGPASVPSVPSTAAAPGTADPLRLPSDAYALVFGGNGMSVATFTVTKKYSLQLDFVTHGGEGKTYGFYVESYDKRTRVGAVHLPGQDVLPSRWTTTYTYGAVLVPGRYRVFLIGSGPTWVSVPFSEKRAGLTVRTTTPTVTLLRSSSGLRAGTSAAAEARLTLPVPERRAVGFMSGQTAGGVAVSRTLVCLTQPGYPCDSSTAVNTSTIGDQARTPVNAAFQVTSSQQRDVATRAELADPASKVKVSMTYLLIYL